MALFFQIGDEIEEQLRKLIIDKTPLDVSTFIMACVNTALDRYVFGTAPIMVGRVNEQNPSVPVLLLWRDRCWKGELTGTAASRELLMWDALDEEQKARFQGEINRLIKEQRKALKEDAEAVLNKHSGDAE